MIITPHNQSPRSSMFSSMPLFDVLDPIGALTYSSETTNGLWNVNIRAALDYIRQGLQSTAQQQTYFTKADQNIAIAQMREEQSTRRAPRVWSIRTNKRIFTPNGDFQAILYRETGAKIIIKQFMTSVIDEQTTPRVHALQEFWSALYKEHQHPTATMKELEGLPLGEISACTNERLISLYFEGSNLWYDHPTRATPRLLQSLLQTNNAIICFAQQFMKNRSSATEAYSKKYYASIDTLLKSSCRTSYDVAVVREDALVLEQEILKNALVPHVDLKSPNIVLNGSIDKYSTTNSTTPFRVIDCDKIDVCISAAHCYAHIFFDPVWNLSFKERVRNTTNYCGTDERSTLASITYYLIRQAALSRQLPVNLFCGEKERERFVAQESLLREVLQHPSLRRYRSLQAVRDS